MNSIYSWHQFLNKLIPFLFALLTLTSINQWMNIDLGPTTFWWSIETLFLIASYVYILSFYIYEKYLSNNRLKLLVLLLKNNILKKNTKKTIIIASVLRFIYKNRTVSLKMPIPITIYLVLVTISIIQGCFTASFYWDWKAWYNNCMIYLLPLTCYYFSIPQNVKSVCTSWIKFAIVSFFILLPFMQLECPAKFLIPFAFFIVFWPYYNKKGVLLCIIAFICVFLFGTLASRSSVIRFLTTLLISIIAIFQNKISKWVLIAISSILIIIPIVFLYLGLSGTFNIFKIGDYIDIDMQVANSYDAEGEAEDLSTDTRTFLYAETICSAIENDYWLFGNSMAQGYYSEWFGYLDEVEGRGMRYACEVGILNVFTNLGIVGVIVYFSIFLWSIINVFRNSKNSQMYLIAILISFRWLFSFVEEFKRFDLNTMFLWLEIAMCNSPLFLNMSSSQFKRWVKGLLIS